MTKHHIAHPAEVNQPDHPQLTALKTFTYTLPANGSVMIPTQNTHFFIMAATGSVSVWGDTFGQLDGLTQGQGMNNIPFNKLIITDQSGATNTVKILVAPGEFTNQILAALVNIGSNGIVSITAAQVLQLIRAEVSSGHFESTAALVANTPVQVFAPASNVNGAIILKAGLQDQASAINGLTLIAKNAAPASITDGEVILQAYSIGGTTSTNVTTYFSGDLSQPQQIAAGLGLYVIGAQNGTAGLLKHCRYKLL